MRNHTGNSIPPEHSCGEQKLLPQPARKMPLVMAGASVLRNLLSWVSFGQHRAMVLESTIYPADAKKNVQCLRGMAQFQRVTIWLQLWDSRGMKGSE